MQRLTNCCHRLALQRAKRHRPHRDDKIITAWNGMMIAALAAGYAATNRRPYLDTAQQTHDYAQLVEGLIALYKSASKSLLNALYMGERFKQPEN